MAANGARPLQAAELRQLARAALRLAEQYTRHQTASIPPLPPPDACGNSNYVLLGRNVDGATEYFWSAASELQGQVLVGLVWIVFSRCAGSRICPIHRGLILVFQSVLFSSGR